MYFALGALSAGLLALLALPAFWRRAVRLSRRRLELVTPMSMEEIVAENDLMRAEFAAERRRIEQRIEHDREDRAADRAELGRRATQIATLEMALDELGAAHGALTEEHRLLVADHAQASGERGAAMIELHDASGLNDRLRAQLAELQRAHDEAHDLAAERAATVAALDARAQSLQLRGETFAQESEERLRGLRLQEERARALGEERDMLIKDLQAYEQRMASALARLESEQKRGADMQEKIEGLRTEAESAEATREAATQSLREAQRARDIAESRAAALNERLIEARRTAHAAESAAADRIEALRSETAALRGALAAAREARNSGSDAEQLRAVLADIGAKVARMAEQDARRA